MSFVKMVRLFCDGPNCQKSVFGATAEEARHYAKYGGGWYSVRKYGIDTCSEACDTRYWDFLKKEQAQAEKQAEVMLGTLEQGVSS